MAKRGNTRARLFQTSITVWILPFLWSVGIFYSSSLPELVLQLPPIRLVDKMIHVIVYAVLNYLVLRACRTIENGRRVISAGIMYSVFFAFSDEVHQYFVPGRFADPLDFSADVIGIFGSTWLFLRFRTIPEESGPNG